jgi:capsular polysaccharide biosynthesis protein
MTPAGGILAAVRRRLWIVVLAVALGTGLGVAASMLETPVYAATTQLLVDTRLSSNGDFDTNLQNTQLLSQYFIAKVTSRTVLQAAAVDEGLPSSDADRLARQVSVQVVKGTDLIAITASSYQPAQAAATANKVAAEVIALNKKEANERFADRRTYLDGELARLDGLIKQEQDALAKLQVGTGSDAEASVAAAISSHQARLNVLQTQYADIYSQRQNVTAQQDLLSNALSVSEPARIPERPVRPVPPLYTAGGALLGLVFGVLLVLLIDRLDPRIHRAEMLAEVTGTRVAVTVDHRRGVTPARIAAAYSMAWATVLAESPTARSVMLVEASKRDSAAKPAAGVAQAAGRLNRAVVVFSGAEAAKASEVPVRAAPETAPNGPDAPSVPEGTLALPLNQPYWDAREHVGAAGYDLVVASVPAPSEHPVAMTLANSADAAIVVATAGRTRLDEARQTAESLRVAGVPLVASILVKDGHKPRPDRSEDRFDREERRSA